jgi:hypothetical protein
MNAGVFPEQDVVLKEDRIAVGQGDVGDGYDLAFDLAGAVSEFDLGHVPQPRRFAPAGIADQILDVELRAAGEARGGGRRVLPAALFTDDALKRFHGGSDQVIPLAQ